MSENVIKIKNLTKEFTLGKFNTKHFLIKLHRNNLRIR